MVACLQGFLFVEITVIFSRKKKQLLGKNAAFISFIHFWGPFNTPTKISKFTFCSHFLPFLRLIKTKELHVLSVIETTQVQMRQNIV